MATERRGRAFSRREALCVGLSAALFARTSMAQQNGGIIVVSRERVLRESDVAETLRDAERRLTAQLQASVDQAKAALDAEEVELTKLRADLSLDEFEERATEFDRKVRQVRREAQERAAVLQRGFQEARATLVSALPRVFERLRVENNALVVLSAEQVLAMDQGIDMTERAIELFNQEGGVVEIPTFDFSSPLFSTLGENGPQQNEGQ